MSIAICESCATVFHHFGDTPPLSCCPLCHETRFRATVIANQKTFSLMPELIVPFTVSKQNAEDKLADFTALYKGLSVRDMTLKQLKVRLRPFYFPMWLADVHVKATW